MNITDRGREGIVLKTGLSGMGFQRILVRHRGGNVGIVVPFILRVLLVLFLTRLGRPCRRDHLAVCS